MDQVKTNQRVAVQLTNGTRVAGIVSWFTPSTICVLRFDGSDAPQIRRSQIDKMIPLG